MKSVERLVAEHDLIERGLRLLEKAVARLDTAGCDATGATGAGQTPTSAPEVEGSQIKGRLWASIYR